VDKPSKIIIFSHNCLSKCGSNGRTLANLFYGWPKAALAQFYISNEIPDSPVCDKYYRITDMKALKAFYKGNRAGNVIKQAAPVDNFANKHTSLNTLYKRNRKRTPFNYIARNLLWDSNSWKSKDFKEWIEEFGPEAVLLQVGDYAFMFKIALNIAKERKIPLILYNSEDYYFKDRKSISLLYHIYRFQYKKQFEKLISFASFSIYNTEMLQETYNRRFKHRSAVIMTGSEVTPVKQERKNKEFIVSYLGNLEVGRHKPLIEVADALQEAAPGSCLDIYGKIPSEEVGQALRACPGIHLKGFVPYDEVVRVMKESDLLVHAENFSKYSQWDLKHAFSTKIADSLASGTCFFVYAPESMVFVKYLQKDKLACVVTLKKDLSNTLRLLLKDKELRQSYIDNALQAVRTRHDVVINSERFKEMVLLSGAESK